MRHVAEMACNCAIPRALHPLRETITTFTGGATLFEIDFHARFETLISRIVNGANGIEVCI
ncbi:MAG TPA: hypothetical protein VFK02_13970 [Kofleriaceae bacterium]|nr:hypothetical protein [Kofleriaceae bacterium]